MAALNPHQGFDGEFELLGRTLSRPWLAQPGVEIALGSPDEPLILL
jgi:hypothetical protein